MFLSMHDCIAQTKEKNNLIQLDQNAFLMVTSVWLLHCVRVLKVALLSWFFSLSFLFPLFLSLSLSCGNTPLRRVNEPCIVLYWEKAEQTRFVLFGTVNLEIYVEQSRRRDSLPKKVGEKLEAVETNTDYLAFTSKLQHKYCQAFLYSKFG